MKTAVMIAHGGPSIGMGHVIRCLALAQQLKKDGCKVSFISKFKMGQEYIENYGFEVISLKVLDEKNIRFDYGSSSELKLELQQVKGILIKRQWPIIIVDSYLIDKDYIDMLKRSQALVCYIDDGCFPDCNADVIINGSINATQINYTSRNSVFLLGMTFNLLRQSFAEQKRLRKSTTIQNILLTTGAADPENVTGQLLGYLSHMDRFKTYQCKVVLTKAFLIENIEQIRQFCSQFDNIELELSPPNMKTLMEWADLCICAGGSTIYELFSCQVPALAFIYAPNQADNVRLAQENGLLLSLGTYQNLTLDVFRKQWDRLIQDDILAQQMRLNMARAVDGRGCERVVNRLRGLISERDSLL